MCKQISSDSFKNEITDKHIMYIYLNVSKQMTDVKLSLLHSNTWNHLTMCKKWAQACLKMLSTKCVYKSYIFNIYV